LVYGRQSQSIVPGHSAPGPQSRWRCLAPTTAYANYAKLKGLQLVKLSAGDSPRAADTPARVADESGTRFVLAQHDVAVDDPAAVPQTPFVRRLVLRQLVAAARRLDELHIMLAGFLDGANTTLVISRSTSRFGLQALTTDVERLCVVAVVIAARLTELDRTLPSQHRWELPFSFRTVANTMPSRSSPSSCNNDTGGASPGGWSHGGAAAVSGRRRPPHRPAAGGHRHNTYPCNMGTASG